MPRLTDRQRAFCHHVLQGMSATEAARKAGYSDSYADREANRLVEKPQVAAYLEELREAAKSDAVMTIEELQGWWSGIVQSGVMPVIIHSDDDEDETMRMPVESKDRMKASDLLGKSLGAFTERHEHDHTFRKAPQEMSLDEVKEELRARGIAVP